MKFAPQELLGLLVATSFAAGLNVYAAVATLGLLSHAGVLPLPPSLEIVSNWWVIGASGVLFLVEFFADKVPAFDLVWNALHTFVRIPVAAFLAYGATAQLSPQKQLLATLLGGGIALAAHGGGGRVGARRGRHAGPTSDDSDDSAGRGPSGSLAANLGQAARRGADSLPTTRTSPSRAFGGSVEVQDSDP